MDLGNTANLPLLSCLLQATLHSLCREYDEWVYAVFWRILPRNYPPPKWDSETSNMDRSKGNKRNWILVWEDGYCNFPACAKPFNNNNISNRKLGNFLQPELFFKMSHEVYNYGEGLMGKIAADNSHKWIYKEPTENDPSFPSSWQGALDPQPRTWQAQFDSGIETIAVVAVKEGLLQLGSLKKREEDLNFVIYLQRKFNYMHSIPGLYAMLSPSNEAPNPNHNYPPANYDPNPDYYDPNQTPRGPHTWTPPPRTCNPMIGQSLSIIPQSGDATWQDSPARCPPVWLSAPRHLVPGIRQQPVGGPSQPPQPVTHHVPAGDEDGAEGGYYPNYGKGAFLY